LFEIWFHYIAQTVLELKILLCPPPEYWDYRNVPPHLVLKQCCKAVLNLPLQIRDDDTTVTSTE
jgi:hypothetical protein